MNIRKKNIPILRIIIGEFHYQVSCSQVAQGLLPILNKLNVTYFLEEINDDIAAEEIISRIEYRLQAFEAAEKYIKDKLKSNNISLSKVYQGSPLAAVPSLVSQGYLSEDEVPGNITYRHRRHQAHQERISLYKKVLSYGWQLKGIDHSQIRDQAEISLFMNDNEQFKKLALDGKRDATIQFHLKNFSRHDERFIAILGRNHVVRILNSYPRLVNSTLFITYPDAYGLCHPHIQQLESGNYHMVLCHSYDQDSLDQLMVYLDKYIAETHKDPIDNILLFSVSFCLSFASSFSYSITKYFLADRNSKRISSVVSAITMFAIGESNEDILAFACVHFLLQEFGLSEKHATYLSLSLALLSCVLGSSTQSILSTLLIGLLASFCGNHAGCFSGRLFNDNVATLFRSCRSNAEKKNISAASEEYDEGDTYANKLN